MCKVLRDPPAIDQVTRSHCHFNLPLGLPNLVYLVSAAPLLSAAQEKVIAQVLL